MPVVNVEIINIANSFAPKASCGYDGISCKIMKLILPAIVTHLCKIFNKSFASGVFPNAMKIAKIVPIFKSGDKTDVKNYRPISLLPVFSKLFEKLMLNRLQAFFTNHNVLNPHQHGFRQHYSTNTAMTDMLDFITKSIDNKLKVLALYLDGSEVFDSLNHSILLSKLEHYEVRGTVLSWFSFYFSLRFQLTEQLTMKSQFRKINSGIPKGSILGPFLYLLFVNDILQSLI